MQSTVPLPRWSGASKSTPPHSPPPASLALLAFGLIGASTITSSAPQRWQILGNHHRNEAPPAPQAQSASRCGAPESSQWITGRILPRTDRHRQFHHSRPCMSAGRFHEAAGMTLPSRHSTRKLLAAGNVYPTKWDQTRYTGLGNNVSSGTPPRTPFLSSENFPDTR